MAADAHITFYTDEHVPPAVSEGLRRRGVDVLTAREAGMLGASDKEHLVAWQFGGFLVVPVTEPSEGLDVMLLMAQASRSR